MPHTLLLEEFDILTLVMVQKLLTSGVHVFLTNLRISGRGESFHFFPTPKFSS
jgi:hypothetical protein